LSPAIRGDASWRLITGGHNTASTPGAAPDPRVIAVVIACTTPA
jgi:hypothetical protein